MLSKAKFRPDGFHSSSSDVTLQKKYGHSSHGPPVAAVPPPPSSDNSAGPPPAASPGANPYAAGSSAFGSANRYGGGAAAGRYPVYGAVSGQPNAVAPPSSGGYSGAPVVAQSYAVFQPGAQPQTQHQQPAVQQLTSTEPQQQAPPAASFMSPPPYQNQPQQPAYPQQQMTQQPQQMNAYQQPPAQKQVPQQPVQQQVPAPMAVSSQQQQPYAAAAQPSVPGPYPMAHTPSTGNVSTASAEEVFASPSSSVKKEEADVAPAVPATEPAARTVTSDSARSSVSSAQELFATSAGEANVGAVVQQQLTETKEPSSEAAAQGAGSNSAEDIAAPASEPVTEPAKQTVAAVPANGAGTAADFFGSNGPASAPVEPATAASNPTLEKAKEDTNENAVESSDGLDDVPLEEVPLTPCEGEPSTGQAAAFSSVGLPPPPFSSRQ